MSFKNWSAVCTGSIARRSKTAGISTGPISFPKSPTISGGLGQSPGWAAYHKKKES